MLPLLTTTALFAAALLVALDDGMVEHAIALRLRDSAASVMLYTPTALEAGW